MLDKKSIKIFKKLMEGWSYFDYTKMSDKEVGETAEKWLARANKPYHYHRRKRTKLFYKVVARLRISKPDYLAIDTIRKRFGADYIRTNHVYQELENAGIIKKINPEKEKSNIDWNKVRKVRVPKTISESVKNMKPERVYPYAD